MKNASRLYASDTLAFCSRCVAIAGLAQVLELADKQDLDSCALVACGFESHPGHHSLAFKLLILQDS